MYASTKTYNIISNIKECPSACTVELSIVLPVWALCSNVKLPDLVWRTGRGTELGFLLHYQAE